MAAWANLSQGQISRIENGPPITDLARLVSWATLLGVPQRLLWFVLPGSQSSPLPDELTGEFESPAAGTPRTPLSGVEDVRRGLHAALTRGAVTSSVIDDWESAVLRLGAATRDRPPVDLVGDLTADLDELRAMLDGCRSTKASRRLLRVIAQVCGLLCLSLIKLGESGAFRRWARTARAAASEADDPWTSGWVLAQEAYGYYYLGDHRLAIDIAREAQAIGRRGDAALPLAAALEARAHAVMQDKRGTHDALARAEAGLSDLEGDALLPSAFGYNEAQLRFHAGSAYTHLHDTRAAWLAQSRALELCAPRDYMDQAMTCLDRATCLLHEGEIRSALGTANDALRSLSDPQRRGIISARGHEILQAVPVDARRLSVAKDLAEVLTTTSGRS